MFVNVDRVADVVIHLTEEEAELLGQYFAKLSRRNVNVVLNPIGYDQRYTDDVVSNTYVLTSNIYLALEREQLA